MSFNYSPKIVRDGLVLHLDAANTKSYASGSTTWRDLTLNGNNGTLTNGPTFSSARNGGILFDGTNDYVSINDAVSLEPASAICLEVVFTHSVLNSYNTIICKPFNGPPWTPPYLSYMLRLNAAGFGFPNHMEIGLNLDGTYKSARHDFTYPLDAIHHVLFNYSNSGSTQYYVNGVLQTLSGSTIIAATSINYSTPPLLLGAGYGASPVAEFLTGTIFLTRIYNRILTANEVQQNYNATKSRFNLV